MSNPGSPGPCAHEVLGDNCGENGHACEDCGVEFVDPANCTACAEEDALAKLAVVERENAELAEALREMHVAMQRRHGYTMSHERRTAALLARHDARTKGG